MGFYNAGFDLKIIGWGYHPRESHKFPFQIISTIDNKDYFGESQARTIIQLWKPDIVFTLGDVYMNNWIKDIPERKEFIHIGYFPIDGTPFPKNWIPVIEDMDYPIVYSQFAYDLISKVMPNKKIKLIMHGVDTNIYKPLGKEEIKFFKKKNDINGRFIVGNVGRNQWRKNIPALFKAFADFSRNKPDAILYYHGAIVDIGWNILDLIDKNSLSGKVLYPAILRPNQGLPEEELNMIYNMMDLFCMPTLGEGFGLPILESQSSGTPVLVTDYSACTELTQGEDELIKVRQLYTPIVKERDVIIDYALVDHDDMVEKMNKFYFNRNLLDKYGKLGREFALKHQWKDKVQDFVDLVNEI